MSFLVLRGSEIYFLNTKDLNLEMKSKLNKINNKTIFEINSIFDHIICLGSYTVKDHESIKDRKDIILFDPEVLWVDLIPDAKINFDEVDGLIFIANDKQKFLMKSNTVMKEKDDIKLIEPKLDEFGHKIRIALFVENVSENRIKKILHNIKDTNKLKNVEFIRVHLDESTTITADNFTEINNELKSDNIELELYSIDYNNWRHEQLYPYKVK